MSDLTEFKRMNFFTGFFTTADDWSAGQDYHVQQRKLHNRGLHTPGVIRGQEAELRVRAAGDLNVRVVRGAALDGEGNTIFLGQDRVLTLTAPPAGGSARLVYISIRFAEQESDYVENVEAPQYSGYTRVSEIPVLAATTTAPDNSTAVELARINLQPGATAVADPVDPANPGPNEIDRRYVVWAGSVVAEAPALAPPEAEQMVLLMQDKRRDFAALGARFPVPSASDVRHAAITVEMLARIGELRPERAVALLEAIALIERDVEQELGAAYPGLIGIPEFQAFQLAVTNLLDALQNGMGLATLAVRQGLVSEAARELSEAVLDVPQAVIAGGNQTVTATGPETTVTLDASGSQAAGGREIVSYHWDRNT